jgi:hypothetical protein
MAPDQNSQFDLDSSMMAEFEADFLVLVFQVASELVEKLGLHFVQETQTYEQQQPRPSIPSTYSQTGQQGQSLQQPKGQGQIYQDQPEVPAQTQGYRFQQPNVSQQNHPSGQQNYQYQQQGQPQPCCG